MIKTIYDNLEIELGEAKQWLNQYFEEAENNPTPEQEELERLIDSAKREADNFLQRKEEYFEHDGTIVIPENIRQWVLELVARDYEFRLSGEVNRSIDGAETVQIEDIDYNKLMQYKKVSATHDDPTIEE